VSTDNGSEFVSGDFRAAVESHGARQRRIKAGRPTSNGCVERVQLTILEECWRPSFARSLVPKITALRRDLEEYLAYYLAYYNVDRASDPRSRPRRDRLRCPQGWEPADDRLSSRPGNRCSS